MLLIGPQSNPLQLKINETCVPFGDCDSYSSPEESLISQSSSSPSTVETSSGRMAFGGAVMLDLRFGICGGADELVVGEAGG